MKTSVIRMKLLLLLTVVVCCEGQRDATLPLSPQSFRQFQRMKMIAPEGRSATLKNVIFRHYKTISTTPASYPISQVNSLLSDPDFDPVRPTVVYAHGYIETTTDESVKTIVSAYLTHGGYNVLVLDWANLAFGNYLVVALGLKTLGTETSLALAGLLKGGLSLKDLHLVGHSMGAHLLASAARDLAAKGYKVPRLTALDPAYPGFYPPVLSAAMTQDDAEFVDVIHTDGGGFGASGKTGQADFWPNEGKAKQPGCVSVTVPLSTEDFCSHWRSWEFWAESVVGGRFLARSCIDYDTFLRGQCDGELVNMGLNASSGLHGNFYLRTAAKAPYALGERGAD